MANSTICVNVDAGLPEDALKGKDYQQLWLEVLLGQNAKV